MFLFYRNLANKLQYLCSSTTKSQTIPKRQKLHVNVALFKYCTITLWSHNTTVKPLELGETCDKCYKPPHIRLTHMMLFQYIVLEVHSLQEHILAAHHVIH